MEGGTGHPDRRAGGSSEWRSLARLATSCFASRRGGTLTGATASTRDSGAKRSSGRKVGAAPLAPTPTSRSPEREREGASARARLGCASENAETEAASPSSQASNQKTKATGPSCEGAVECAPAVAPDDAKVGSAAPTPASALPAPSAPPELTPAASPANAPAPPPLPNASGLSRPAIARAAARPPGSTLTLLRLVVVGGEGEARAEY